MDDLKLLEALRRETPPITAAAAQSARARLLAAAAERPRPAARRGDPRRGLVRVGWRVAVAAALGLALTAGITVTRDADRSEQGRSPAALLPVGVANAAELGERAATVTAAQPDLHPRPHQWTYTETVRATNEDLTPFSAVGARRETTRSWMRIDAKQHAIEYQGRLHRMPNHQLSSVYPWRSFAYVRQLPTDPQALLTRLYATYSPAGERPYNRLRFSREEQDQRAFSLVADLLRDNVVPPGVQAAIYRALPSIPGVQLQRDAVDAAGRHGFAFARVYELPSDDGRIGAEIILDPRTYQYLGWRQVVVNDFVADNVTIDGKRVRPRVAKGTVFDWTARTSAAIVNRPGQRPAGPTAPFGAPATSGPSEVTATSRLGPDRSFPADLGEVQSPVGAPPGAVGEQMVADVAGELARCRGGDSDGPKVLVAWDQAIGQTWLVMAKPPRPGDKRLCWADGLFNANGAGGVASHHAPPELLQASGTDNLRFGGEYWGQVVGAVTKRAARVQVHFDTGTSPLELVPIQAGDRFPVNFYAGVYRQPAQDNRPASWAVTRVVAYDDTGQLVAECQATAGAVKDRCG
jgi:hypothetical protein